MRMKFVWHLYFNISTWLANDHFPFCCTVRQPGRITRIASGCTAEQQQSLTEWHIQHIVPLSLRFGLHFTPHFSSVKDENGKSKGEYEFFNKPFGLKHWMEHADGMGIDPEKNLPWKHDTIIALLDPDQLLVRPITGHFGSPEDIFRENTGSSTQNVDSNLSGENKPQFMVRHGHPVSQEYGFGASWLKYASVAGSDSPATKVTTSEAFHSYAVGPPYIATALDMYDIAVKWSEFVPKVYARMPELLAEMYAFSIATAHLGLPHQLLASLMVSETSTGGGEGWNMIDNIPGEEICSFAMTSLENDVHPLPNTLHLCQRYGVGDKDFFAKKKLPHNFFTCESPLLKEPTRDIGSGRYKYRIPPFLDTKVEYSAITEKREAFMICASIGFLNEASIFYKYRHCGDNANLNKEISLHDLPE